MKREFPSLLPWQIEALHALDVFPLQSQEDIALPEAAEPETEPRNRHERRALAAKRRRCYPA